MRGDGRPTRTVPARPCGHAIPRPPTWDPARARRDGKRECSIPFRIVRANTSQSRDRSSVHSRPSFRLLWSMTSPLPRVEMRPLHTRTPQTLRRRWVTPERTPATDRRGLPPMVSRWRCVVRNSPSRLVSMHSPAPLAARTRRTWKVRRARYVRSDAARRKLDRETMDKAWCGMSPARMNSCRILRSIPAKTRLTRDRHTNR